MHRNVAEKYWINKSQELIISVSTHRPDYNILYKIDTYLKDTSLIKISNEPTLFSFQLFEVFYFSFTYFSFGYCDKINFAAK
jgi:hypothetical protein